MLILTRLLNSILSQRLLSLITMMMMITLGPPLYLPPYNVLYNIFPRLNLIWHLLPFPPHFLHMLLLLPLHVNHLFTTMADESLNPDPSYPYVNAAGHTVDVAIQDEVMMAHVCHYVMMHTKDKLYAAPSSTKKQYGLKAGLRLFGDCRNSAIQKELTQFHTL
jgi:hypothetical protein